jgi:hypothetical protein
LLRQGPKIAALGVAQNPTPALENRQWFQQPALGSAFPIVLLWKNRQNRQMICRLAILLGRQLFALAMMTMVVLSLLAADCYAQQSELSSGAGQGGSSDARLLLDKATVRLSRYATISANLRQRIDLYGRKLIGTGTYRHKNTGRDLLFRSELKVPVGDAITSLLQVCDGRFLWTYRALPHEEADRGLVTTLTRADLEAVRRQTAKQHSVTGLGYGGLIGMLEQTSRLFEFSDVHRSVLHGVPVWTVTGNWREQVTDSLTGNGDAQENNPFPDQHLPDAVTIALGVDDLFPYRIEYRRYATNAASAKSIVVAGARARAIVTIELFEVELNGRIDPQVFQVRHSGVRIEDTTAKLLQNHSIF